MFLDQESLRNASSTINRKDSSGGILMDQGSAVLHPIWSLLCLYSASWQLHGATAATTTTLLLQE